MKTKSKASTIVRAFISSDKLLPQDVIDHRRSKCSACPFNSGNQKGFNLKRWVKNLIKGNHCTICGCFIKEKTSQPNEECALSMINEKPLWNKMKIETISKNSFNLVNNSPDVMNVGLTSDNEAFLLTFGDMAPSHPKKKHVFKGSFTLEHPTKDTKIVYVGVSCGCTKPHAKTEDNKTTVDFTVDIKYIPQLPNRTEVKKAIYIHYLIGTKQEKLTVNIDGVIQWNK